MIKVAMTRTRKCMAAMLVVANTVDMLVTKDLDHPRVATVVAAMVLAVVTSDTITVRVNEVVKLIKIENLDALNNSLKSRRDQNQNKYKYCIFSLSISNL